MPVLNARKGDKFPVEGGLLITKKSGEGIAITVGDEKIGVWVMRDGSHIKIKIIANKENVRIDRLERPKEKHEHG